MTKPFLFKASALALAAGLLSGYTLDTGRIAWVYHGTPATGSNLPYNPNTGAPSNLETTQRLPAGLPALPADLVSKINFTLPESRDIRLNAQGLIPDSDDKTNLRFDKDAEVWVTFVNERAGYRNSVGYFLYDPASPPTSPAQVQEKIIFANASTPSPLDTADANRQNTVYIGRVPAGKALGFVIVADGFSSTGRLLDGRRIGGVKDNASPNWIFYTLRGLNPERPGPANLNVHTVMLKDATDASAGYQRVVLGFEDINRESGGDHDFNDVVLAVHVTPGASILNLNQLPTLVGANDKDSDGDGVKDALDEFPNDPARAFSRYYPGADGWGTLAYEDQWPQRGDYDMNDVVLRYRTREVLNAQRQVVALEIDYRSMARGGIIEAGFGLHLPGVPAAAVRAASLQAAGGPVRALGVEPGQTEASFVVAASLNTHMPLPASGSCRFVNTESGCPTVAAVPYRLTVDFATPQAATLFSPPYNPFIFRTARRGQEVHLPGRPATALADRSLFATGDDRSPASGSGSTTYMDAQRRPWALDIPTAWVWPLETIDLLQPYPRFAEWATSGGTLARDWYLQGVVNPYLVTQRP